MRLDVREVQAPVAPVLCRFVDKLHRPASRVRRLRMLLGDARRLVAMRQQPAIAVIGRIGPFLPRVLAIEPVAAQVIVISRPLLRVALWMQPVVALVGFETALRQMHAERRAGIDAEPLHAGQIGRHMRLADQHGAHAELREMVAQCRLADAQREAVPIGAVRAHVAAGVKAHPRRPAHRRLHIGAVEAHAARRQRIDVRRLHVRMAVAAEIIEPQLVAHDEKDVFAGHLRPRCTGVMRPSRRA